MNSDTKEANFTSLFMEHVPKGYDFNVGGERHSYAFEFLHNLEENFSQVSTSRYQDSFSLYKASKVELQESLNRFEFEYATVINNKTGYLNGTVKRLIVLLKNLGYKKSDNPFSNQVLQIIESLIKEGLNSIFISHHLELTESNRAYLSKWYYLKEPIQSFKFVRHPEERRLEELYKKYLLGNFVAYQTPFSTFKSLFEKRRLVNKINWVGNKTSLFFFIKLLREHDIIKNTKNKHWSIVSEFFLLKGESLEPKDFTNQKEPKTKETREPLEKFVQSLR